MEKIKPGMLIFLSCMLIGSLSLLFYTLPTRKAFWFLCLSLTWTSAGEYLGQKYGLFFVKYQYHPEAWPTPLSSIVQLAVPLMWFMMMLPSWIIARSLTANRLLSPLLTGALMTVLDFFMDPLFVKKGMWSWEHSDHLFLNIPAENFLAWFLGVAIAIFSAETVLKEVPPFSKKSLRTACALYSSMMLYLLMELIH